MPKSKHTAPPQGAERIVPTSSSEKIQYIGLRDLDEDERAAVEEIVTKYHDKMKRKVRNVTSLNVHVKVHGAHKDECHGEEEEVEKKHKHTVHLRLIAPTQIFESEDSDYDVRKAMHLVCEHMLNQLEHAYHEDEGVASKMLAPGQSRKTPGKND